MATQHIDSNGVRWQLVDVPSRPGFFFGTMEVPEEGGHILYDPVPPDTQVATAPAVIARIAEFAKTHKPVLVVKSSPTPTASSNMGLVVGLLLLWLLTKRR